MNDATAIASPIHAPTPIASDNFNCPTRISNCGNTGMIRPNPIASIKIVSKMKIDDALFVAGASFMASSFRGS